MASELWNLGILRAWRFGIHNKNAGQKKLFITYPRTYCQNCRLYCRRINPLGMFLNIWLNGLDLIRNVESMPAAEITCTAP